MLPEVRASSEVYGDVSTTLGVGGVPIAGIAGDQQAALFGQMCISPGLTKNTYGTGCFMLQNTGERPVASQQPAADDGRLAGRRQDDVCARRQRVHRRRGRAVAPRRARASSRSRPDVEALAASVPDNGGVYLVPAFAGLGAPHWDPYAAARSSASPAARPPLTSRGPRSRASPSRSPTCSTRCGTTPAIELTELRVDGGAAANDVLMQFQADMLGVPVVRPAVTETTALGAAYLAGLAVGFWDSTDALAQHWQSGPAVRAGDAALAGRGAPRRVARGAEPLEGLDRARDSSMHRSDMVARLDDRRGPWDIVVIGGGATGVGIAVDAASRGYDVLLLEQHDFGKGTSSRSTKLVHGGVRYLEQGNIALVMEALKERGLLRQNAPHLVSNLAFVVPNYDWWEAPFYGLGLKIYNVLAGKYGFGSSEILSRDETLARLPTIKTDGLRGGVVYYDGQFDDARLLINLVADCCRTGRDARQLRPRRRR